MNPIFDDTDYRVQAAEELIDEGKYAEALAGVKSALEEGSAAAMRLFGECCLHGWGVKQSVTAARHWWEHAIEAGDTDAITLMGDSYYYEDNGCTRDDEQALKWYAQAAEELLAACRTR